MSRHPGLGDSSSTQEPGMEGMLGGKCVKDSSENESVDDESSENGAAMDMSAESEASAERVDASSNGKARVAFAGWQRTWYCSVGPGKVR